MSRLDHFIIRKRSMHFKMITFSNKYCTVGNWLHDGEVICHTMEKSWHRNKKGISCVPAGLYDFNLSCFAKLGANFLFEQ